MEAHLHKLHDSQYPVRSFFQKIPLLGHFFISALPPLVLPQQERYAPSEWISKVPVLGSFASMYQKVQHLEDLRVILRDMAGDGESQTGPQQVSRNSERVWR